MKKQCEVRRMSGFTSETSRKTTTSTWISSKCSCNCKDWQEKSLKEPVRKNSFRKVNISVVFVKDHFPFSYEIIIIITKKAPSNLTF